MENIEAGGESFYEALFIFDDWHMNKPSRKKTSNMKDQSILKITCRKFGSELLHDDGLKCKN